MTTDATPSPPTPTPPATTPAPTPATSQPAANAAAKVSWHIVETDSLHPGVRALGVDGRLLDVSASGELAVLLDHDDTLASIAPGAGPRELARHVEAASWAPDGKRLAIVRNDRDGMVLEYPLGTVLLRHPHYGYSNVRVSRDGKHVAVVEHDAQPDSRGRLLILDDKGNRVAETKIYPGIEGVAWSPDGGEVWFSEWTDLHAVSLSGRDHILFSSFLMLNLRDVAPDGRILVAPTDYRFGTFIGPLAGPKRELGWYDSAVVQSLSHDGSVVAFLLGNGLDQQPDGYACYVRKGDAAPIPIGHAFKMALVPDGSAVILLTAKPALRYVPLTAGATRELDLGPITELDRRDHLEVTRDGKHLIVRGSAAGKPMRLWSFDLAGTAPPIPFGPDEAADQRDRQTHPVSADGRWLAVSTERGVRLIGIATGAQFGTPDGKSFDIAADGPRRPLRFTLDGKALIVQYERTPTLQRLELTPPMRRLHVTTLEIADPTRWVDPVVSGDAATVAYSFPRSSADLYVIEPPAAASNK